MLKWNDMMLFFLNKINPKGKQLYVQIMDDNSVERIYFDKVDEDDKSIAIKFTRQTFK